MYSRDHELLVDEMRRGRAASCPSHCCRSRYLAHGIPRAALMMLTSLTHLRAARRLPEAARVWPPHGLGPLQGQRRAPSPHEPGLRRRHVDEGRVITRAKKRAFMVTCFVALRAGVLNRRNNRVEDAEFDRLAVVGDHEMALVVSCGPFLRNDGRMGVGVAVAGPLYCSGNCGAGPSSVLGRVMSFCTCIH
jgi:hypothetical protein